MRLLLAIVVLFGLVTPVGAQVVTPTYVYSQSYVPGVRVRVETEVATYETYQYLFPGADARFIPLVKIKIYQNPVGVIPAGPLATTQTVAIPPQISLPPVTHSAPQQLAPATVQATVQPQVLAPAVVPGYPYATPYVPTYRRRVYHR